MQILREKILQGGFLLSKGLEKTDNTIGWDIMFQLSGDGEIGFVESSGATLRAQRTALEDIDSEMSELGNDSADRPPGRSNVTVTEAVIAHAQRSSALLKIADSLKDAVEQAVEIHGEYLNYKKEQVCSTDLSYKPEELVLSPANIDLLFKPYDNGSIKGETLLKCFKGGGSLPDDMDVETEVTAARAEFQMRMPKTEIKKDSAAKALWATVKKVNWKSLKFEDI